MDLLLSLMTGIGLAAACGFRVFVPMLVASLAARSGHLTLATGFEWIASDLALVAFLVATLLEVIAYFTPWLDNALDAVASPAAVVAGTLLVSAVVAGDFSPYLKWSLAVIAGGASAAVTQAATVKTRLLSLGATGGMANPVVSGAELIGSTSISLLSMLVPMVACFVVLAALAVVVCGMVRKQQRRRAGSHGR
jgi:hypothetical protein